MLASLHLLFSVLCGQYADHTFVPGGLWLPCCQRCTGLYGGAAMAALLHLWLRPRLTARWLALHGLCIALMVPCGAHWIPQGPVLRAASGAVFAFGVFTFLWAPVRARMTGRSPNGSRGAPTCWLVGSPAARWRWVRWCSWTWPWPRAAPSTPCYSDGPAPVGADAGRARATRARRRDLRCFRGGVAGLSEFSGTGFAMSTDIFPARSYGKKTFALWH